MIWEAAIVIFYTFGFALAVIALNEHSPLARFYTYKRTFFFTTNR